MNRTLPRPTVVRGRTLAVSGLLLTSALTGCTVAGPPPEAAPTSSTTDEASTQQGTTGVDPIPPADKEAWMKTVTSMQKTDDDTLYHHIAALWNGTANAPFEETTKIDVPVAKYAITLICAGRGHAVATVRFGNQEVVTPALDCTPSHAKETTTISTTKDADSLTVKMQPEGSRNTVIAGVDVVRAGSATSADETDRSPTAVPTSTTTTTTSKSPTKQPTTTKPAPTQSTFTTRPRPTFTTWRPTYPPGYPTPTRYPSTWPPSDD